MGKVYFINESDVLSATSSCDPFTNVKNHKIICSDYMLKELATGGVVKIDNISLSNVPELVINGVRVPSLKTLSKPIKYIINKGATILFWADGSKTVVKRTSEDEHNKRLAFLTAYFQKHCGLSKNQANKYLDSLMDEDDLKKLDFINNGGLDNIGNIIGDTFINFGKLFKTNKEE